MADRTGCFNAYDIDRIRGFLELAMVGGLEGYQSSMELRPDADPW